VRGGPPLQRIDLVEPVGLARPQRDRAVVRDEQRIEGVDEVRARGLRVELVDRRAETRQQLDERVVLAHCHVEVDRVQEAVRRIVERPAEGRPRPLHEDLAQRRGHALGAVPASDGGHARRIPAPP
jgi:hypothetical protein